MMQVVVTLIAHVLCIVAIESGLGNAADAYRVSLSVIGSQIHAIHLIEFSSTGVAYICVLSRLNMTNS